VLTNKKWLPEHKQMFLLVDSQHVSAQIGHHQVILAVYTNGDGLRTYTHTYNIMHKGLPEFRPLHRDLQWPIVLYIQYYVGSDQSLTNKMLYQHFSSYVVCHHLHIPQESPYAGLSAPKHVVSRSTRTLDCVMVTPLFFVDDLKALFRPKHVKDLRS
jgi:hypothetical protein